MRLSSEEKALVKKNLEAISEWVDSIKDGVRKCISVPIPHEYYKIEFNIDKEGCWVNVGNSTMYLTSKNNDGTDSYYYLKVLSNNSELGVHFISNWKMVREKIDKQLEVQRTSINSLKNFSV